MPRPLSLALIAVVTVVVASLAGPAPAAHAHGTAGQSPRNWRSRVIAIEPAVAGLSVRTTDLGEHVEVTSDEREVIVIGYDGEQFLRVGPDGVWRNERSPAVFFNRSRAAREAPPAEFDAAAAPEWERIGDGPSFRWHDHRAHPMGRDRSFVWTIELRAGATTISVRGDVEPLTSPALALVLIPLSGSGAAVVIAARRRPASAVASALALLAAAAIALSIARWTASTESSAAKLAVVSWPLLAAALGTVAAVRVAQRGLPRAAPLALFGAGSLTIASGLALVPWLANAHLPASGPAALWRTIVAIILGAGALCTAAAARALRQHEGGPRQGRPHQRDTSQPEASASAAMRRAM